MTNPYAATTASLEEFSAPDASAPRIFAFSGRIGRVRMLAYGGLLLLLLFLSGIVAGATRTIGGASAGTIAQGAVYVFAIFGQIVLTRRRLQDLDHHAWVTSLMLIPGLNLLLWLYLAFAPGTRGQNTYGPEPANNSFGVKLGAFLSVLLSVLLVASVVFFLMKFSSLGLTGRP